MLRNLDQVKNISRQAVLLLQNTIPITATYLFGSYSLGKANDNSDIDLAVFSPQVENMGIEEKIELIGQVQKNLGLGAELEIHLFPERCLKEARPTNLYGHILATGLQIDLT